MPTAVVTGANSGIGHAFAELLIKEGYEVHAADFQIGEELQSLQCRLHRLDVRSPESIQGFGAALAGKPVDLLLHVAGVMDPPAQDALPTVTKAALTRVFETNTFGPLLLTQALLENLLASTSLSSSLTTTEEEGQAPPPPPQSTAHPFPRIGIVSSRVGSMGDNTSGGSYAYRASKAAVNSVGRSLAVDLHPQSIFVALLHPGIVNSNLATGAERPAPDSVEPEEAAGKLYALLMAKGMEETGRFWHREGQELPW